MSSLESNRQAAADFFEQIWNQKDESAIDRFIALDAALQIIPACSEWDGDQTNVNILNLLQRSFWCDRRNAIHFRQQIPTLGPLV